MSKTAKAKARPVSQHSRAARRATSPSLQGNVSQNLKDLQPPKRSKTTHIFSGPRDAGIKKKKGKQLKRGQLERQRKVLERGEIVAAKTDKHLEKSLARLKTVKSRRKEWDGINAEAEVDGKLEGGAVKGSRFAGLEGLVEGEVEREDGWEDEKDGVVEEILKIHGDGDEIMKLDLPVRTTEAPIELVVAEEKPQEEDIVQ
jgi:hypothetical protein